MTHPVSNAISLAHCSLHTAQYTLGTSPAPANAPESEHVNFILHIENCTPHTRGLYWILYIVHLTLQKSKFACVGLKIYMENVPSYNQFSNSDTMG